MAVDGRLNFDTKINTKGFSKGLSSLGSQLNGLKSVVFKLGAALGLAFGSKEMIESAASVNAAASQLTQTFGSLQSQAEAAMQSVADNSGIVVTRLQEVGTSIYAFAKTAGMDSATALNMMQEALQVTADQAAYYDRSLEDTAESLKSFLKGNYANDAALGISCTETTRNAAANKLYGKSFADLSEAQKQITLLQMVKDANELSGAMGQAAREAEGWENVIGNLKETWRQLLAVVGQPVLSVAVTVVKSMTAELQKLTSVARSAVSAFSDVFGIELMNTTDGVAESSSRAADSYADMAASAEEAAEAQENSLASFDQINKLGDSKDSASASASDGGTTIGGLSGSTISASVDIDTSSADKKLTNFFKWVKASFNTIFDPFKQAWNKKGTKVVDSIRYNFSGIYGLISAIGGSFARVWTNGTGEKTVGHILEIFTNINTTIGNIANNLKTTWTTDNLGTNIVQHAADIWNTILGHIENITKKISDWSAKVDFEPLLSSFDTLEIALQPFADTIGAGLEDFFNEVLLPLASWTIEDVLPTFLETLSEIIEGLTAAWNTAYPVLKEKLWDEFLKPIAEWAGDKAVKLLDKFGDAIKYIGENITEEQVEVLIDLAGAIGSIVIACKSKTIVDNMVKSLSNVASKVSGAYQALSAPVGAAGVEAGVSYGTQFAAALGAFFVGWNIGSIIYDLFGDAIDSVLHPFFDAWLLGFNQIKANVMEFISYLTTGWDMIIEFFTVTIPEAWNSFQECFQIGCDAIIGFFTGLWESICGFFGGIGDWFGERFDEAWESITTAWSDVKQWFSDRWDDITGVFSSVGSWFGEKFTIAWGSIQSAFANIKLWFSDRWADIKGVFSGVKKWFSDKFSGAWDGIKSAFSGVGKFFGGVWDDMSSGVKGAINTIIDGLNWMIGGINSISFDMPDWDWLPDGVQGATLGINIPEIPKLATGAVIPPNSEFLAILGDQKRGTNIEAPLETIKQALLEALVAYGGTGGNQKVSLTVPITLNGRVITQLVIDDINDYIKRNGKSPINA